eukprot:359740-Chlamydomonas_euryale.AAC.2
MVGLPGRRSEGFENHMPGKLVRSHVHRCAMHAFELSGGGLVGLSIRGLHRSSAWQAGALALAPAHQVTRREAAAIGEVRWPPPVPGATVTRGEAAAIGEVRWPLPVLRAMIPGSRIVRAAGARRLAAGRAGCRRFRAAMHGCC